MQPVFNKQIIQFFVRVFIVFSIWFVVYNLILKPGRMIDKPITSFITAGVVNSINLTSGSDAVLSWEHDKVRDCTHLLLNGNNIFNIYDVCNGIDLMFIYAGILVLLPGGYKRKIVFVLGGIVAIIAANIIRIAALYYIYIFKRSAFDFSHHYLFTLLMYILIVYGWLLFIKKVKVNNEAS